MKTNFKKKLIFFIVSSCIFVSSCSFSGDNDIILLKAAGILTANNSGSSEKVRINLDFEDPCSRTILASQDLTDLKFSGERTDGGSYSTSAGTKAALCAQEIWLQTGMWNFTVEGKIDGVTFKGKVENFDLKADNISISFDLNPYSDDNELIGNGGLYFVLNFTGTADYAELKITDTATNQVADSNTYNFDSVSGSSDKKSIEYSKSFKTQNLEGFAPGTYQITVNFYRNNMKSDDSPLNTWEAYARIKAGLTATAVINDYDLTESYKITYNDIEGAELGSGIVVRCYSRKSGTISLPSYTNAAGFKILCWYETEVNINTLGITSFESSKLKDMDLYPLWDTDTVYVAENGTGNALTEAKAASSVAEALSTLQKLNEYGSEQTALTVQISGEVTGTTTIGTSLDDFAASLTLCGKTGNTVDSLYGNNSGTVLTVNTAVPVTIKKLKLDSHNSEGSIGISIPSNIAADVTIDEGTLITGNKVPENPTDENKITGMGVCVLSSVATFTMKGGEISGNTAVDGAGILSTGFVIIKDGKISGNTASEYGGGIHIEGGTLSIEGGEISGNFVQSETLPCGGGGICFINSLSTFTMTGGEICNNSSPNMGGGVCILLGTFDMQGGTIYENSASFGGAVYSSATFKIKENAYISYGVTNTSGVKEYGAGKNDVYLSSNAYITVAGSLTGTAPVATVTALEWIRGKTIIQADGTNVQNLTNCTSYFALTNTDWEKKVSSDASCIFLDAPIYVKQGGSASATGTKSAPRDTIANAIQLCNNESIDYIIKIDGSLNGTQNIPNTLTKTSVGTYKAKSLTLEGVTGNTTDILKLTSSGTLLTVNTTVPVTIKNLKLNSDNVDDSVGIAIPSDVAADLMIDEGTLITGNKNVTANENTGMGILVSSSTAKVTMEGGEISGNSAVYGAGVACVGTFTMTGGTITENSATSYGGAVFNGGTFNMSGSACIPYGVTNALGTKETGTGKNDVYLLTGKTITITDGLTGDAPVATITPATYTDGTTVLSGETSLLSANYNKFSLSDDENYFIGAGGILYGLAHTSASLEDFKDYLSSLPSDKEATLTISSDLATNSMSASTPALTIPSNANVTLTAESAKKIEYTIPDDWPDNGSDSYKFIKVESGATLTIGSGITISGTDFGYNQVCAICVEDGAQVIMEDGASITGFIGNGNGTIIVYEGGIFTMNGGTISDCKARYGGGVYIYKGGIFNFLGGSITNISLVNGAVIDGPTERAGGGGTMNRKTSSTTITVANSKPIYGNTITVNEI